MGDRLKETVGFLSRWLLLAVVGMSGLGVSWLLLSASAAGATAGEQLVLSDEVWTPWWAMHVTGYLQSGRQEWMGGLFTVRSSDGRPGRVFGPRGRVCAAVGEFARPGEVHHVRVWGRPYGRMAFTDTGAICRVVAADEQVFAIDTRLVDGNDDRNDGAVAECIELLDAAGQVVFFHTGSAEEFAAVRRGLIGRYPLTPVVFARRDRPTVTGALKQISWTLHRGPAAGPVVITRDGDLARPAAAMGYSIHLIGPVATALPGVIGHDSDASLRDWLIASRDGATEVGGRVQ